MKMKGNFVKDVLVPLLTALTAITALVLNASSSQKQVQNTKDINDLEAQLHQQEVKREERESVQDFSLKIYDVVVDSLKAGDEREQQAAKALVIVMLEDPLRSSLLGTFEQVGVSDVQEEASQIIKQEAEFNLAEPPTPEQTPLPNWRDWNYDIFWCTSSGTSAEAQAQKVKDVLLSEGFNDNNVRVRELPQSINASTGYRIHGYVIRRSTDEEDPANSLKGYVEQALDTTFIINTSTSRTDSYISTFICP